MVLTETGDERAFAIDDRDRQGDEICADGKNRGLLVSRCGDGAAQTPNAVINECEIPQRS